MGDSACCVIYNGLFELLSAFDHYAVLGIMVNW